jgi:multidrug resistance efflux pump
MLIPYPFTVGGDFRLLPVHQLGIRAQVSGEIKSVLLEEGQLVKKGQPVALLVGREQEKKVEEIKAALDEVKARVELLQEGPKPEEIAKAKQEVRTAAKSLEYSQLQAERYAKMFKDKAVSEKDYENVLRRRDLDRERLELAKKNLELVQSGARDQEIEALEAEVRRLEVDFAHAQEDLRLTTLVSPVDGRLITPYLSQTVGQFLGVGDLFAVVENATTIMAEIRVPEEDAGEVKIGSRVKLKTWTYPNTSFMGNVVVIAPVAYEKSRRRVERTLSEREWRFEQEEILKEKGKVVRVLSELPNSDGLLKTDMTGYAKIECEWKPLVVAFTRWLVRFFLIEVWSWIPGFLW